MGFGPIVPARDIWLCLLCCLAFPSDGAASPNILLLLADDLGSADLALLGGEIDTPNIEQIANSGTVYTRFYTSPLCAPSRAMLMTGRDAHEVGLGNQPAVITGNQRELPGYEGFLNADALTVATRLSRVGYFTAMAGKWHLGYGEDGGPAAKGFERFFALGNGGASHYADMSGPHLLEPDARYVTHDGPVSKLNDNFYSSDGYTTALLSFLRENQGSGKPFLAYLAFTAPHWPLQVPREDRERFAGRYDGGYEVLRTERFQRQQKMGLSSIQELPPWPMSVPRWGSLTADEQRRESRLMEVYAGMVARLDWNIGRVLAYLRETGELDNTLIIFASDNGPAGSVRESKLPVFENYITRFDNSYANLGLPGSYSLYHQGWAVAGSTPYRGYKGYPYEGGIRVPAIIQYPLGVVVPKGHNDRMASLLDLSATMLDVAAVKSPADLESPDRMFTRPVGRSVVAPVTKDSTTVFATEVNGNVALLSGSMKLVRANRRIGNERWEVYDLARDPGEQRDLAGVESDSLRQLLKHWDQLVEELGVVFPEGQSELLAQ